MQRSSNAFLVRKKCSCFLIIKMSNNYRCRKCRCCLFSKESTITCHNEKLINVSDDQQNECYDRSSNVIFVDDRKINEQWIQEQIDVGEWIKGRLTCPTNNCKARVGCYNFINAEFCHCGKYQLPPIQFNRSKVDVP